MGTSIMVSRGVSGYLWPKRMSMPLSRREREKGAMRWMVELMS